MIWSWLIYLTLKSLDNTSFRGLRFNWGREASWWFNLVRKIIFVATFVVGILDTNILNHKLFKHWSLDICLSKIALTIKSWNSRDRACVGHGHGHAAGFQRVYRAGSINSFFWAVCNKLAISFRSNRFRSRLRLWFSDRSPILSLWAWTRCLCSLKHFFLQSLPVYHHQTERASYTEHYCP